MVASRSYGERSFDRQNGRKTDEKICVGFAPVLSKALRDWGRLREQLDAGEITLEEYRDWKDAYLPQILSDPVTGKEIDDPYTGRRLEGVEREGARRAVPTMKWLNWQL